MTFLAIKLLMGKALERLLGLFKFALAHPWQAALILAVCALFWQHRAIGQRDGTIAQQTALIAEMQAKAKQARATSVTIAKDSDHAHETRLADNRDRTTVFIAANRVRPKGCVSAPAEGEAAGASESAPAVPLVAVSEADVKACGDLQAYAESAYQWGQAQVKAGLAD